MNLLDEYPRPWTLQHGPNGAYGVIAANGKTVMSQEDYSGDGAAINFDGEQAQALCDLVNRD